MLTFVGLGLYDETSITIQGQRAIRTADRVFMESYTGTLTGTTIDELEAVHDVSIDVRDRDGVEGDPEPVLDAAADGEAAFCVVGDPMISTTHVDLRLRAAERGIATRIVHGTTAAAAAAGLTGLQNYRFGTATTLPFPHSMGADDVPASVHETIAANQDRGLHTLVYLDIDTERDQYMTGDQAAAMLATDRPETLGVVVARAGSADPLVVGDHLADLADQEFGSPLHLLVLPGRLHHVERQALATFAAVPADAFPDGM